MLLRSRVRRAERRNGWKEINRGACEVRDGQLSEVLTVEQLIRDYGGGDPVT